MTAHESVRFQAFDGSNIKDLTKMDWHCGLLDDPTLAPGERNPIRTANWHTLPPHLERELRIWLAMPGFSFQYHVETLEREPREIRQFMGGYSLLEDDVLLNWASATRDDCLKLAWIRPENGDLPTISKLSIRRDYLRGRVQKEIADEYGVCPATVNKLCWGLPDDWDSLPEALQTMLERDPFISGHDPTSARRLDQRRDAERALARQRSSPLPEEEVRRIEEIVSAAGARLLAEETERHAAAARTQEKVLQLLFGSLQLPQVTATGLDN